MINNGGHDSQKQFVKHKTSLNGSKLYGSFTVIYMCV